MKLNTRATPGPADHQATMTRLRRDVAAADDDAVRADRPRAADPLPPLPPLPLSAASGGFAPTSAGVSELIEDAGDSVILRIAPDSDSDGEGPDEPDFSVAFHTSTAGGFRGLGRDAKLSVADCLELADLLALIQVSRSNHEFVLTIPGFANVSDASEAYRESLDPGCDKLKAGCLTLLAGICRRAPCPVFSLFGMGLIGTFIVGIIGTGHDQGLVIQHAGGTEEVVRAPAYTSDAPEWQFAMVGLAASTSLLCVIGCYARRLARSAANAAEAVQDRHQDGVSEARGALRVAVQDFENSRATAQVEAAAEDIPRVSGVPDADAASDRVAAEVQIVVKDST